MPENLRLIYVDLDETLVRIDLLRFHLKRAILRRPQMLFKAVWWLMLGGRPRLKFEMANAYPIDIAIIPFNDELIALLKEKRASGAELILATAAPRAWADTISEHVGIFNRVLATDPVNGNLKGKNKLAKILDDAKGQPFAYAGDSTADRVIFEAAELPIVIGHRAELAGANSDKALVLPPP